MTLTYTYQTTGPASFPLKQSDNNAQLRAKMAMPKKFYPSAGDSLFSSARKTYISDGGGGAPLQGHHDQSSYIHLRKINAIGKSSTKNITAATPISFRSNDNNTSRSAIRRCRSGGCIAPKKKGAYKYNYYTASQVATHNSFDNAWVTLGNKVYNITLFNHPGQSNPITENMLGNAIDGNVTPHGISFLQQQLLPYFIGFLI